MARSLTAPDRRRHRRRWLVLVGALVTGAPAMTHAAGSASAAGPPEPPNTPPAAVDGIGPLVVQCQHLNDHMRISLPWSADTPYTISRDGRTVTLALSRPVRLEMGAFRAAAGRCGQAVAVRPGTGSVTLSFQLPANVDTRDALVGPNLVIDLFRRPAPVQPSAADRPAAPPAASPTPSPASTPPPPTATATSPLVGGASPADASATASSLTEAPAIPPPPQPLQFIWPAPVAAAAFRRGDIVWLIFDQPSQQDSDALLHRAQSAQLTGIDQRPHPRATILRLKTTGGLTPQLARNGNTWIVRFDGQSNATPASPIAAHPDAQKNGSMRLLLPIAEPAEPVAFTDPVAGDSLIAVPLRSLGAGVARGYELAQLRLVPSVQGIVIQPLVDDVRVHAFTEGVEITRRGDLQLSPVSEATRALALLSTAPDGSRVIPEDAWPAAAPAEFAEYLATITKALTSAGEADRPRALLDLVRFYLAAGLAAEAAGALERLRVAAPSAMDDPEARLLRGIAAWMLGRGDGRAADPGTPAIAATDEGQLWRAIATGSPPDAAALPHWSTIIARYPPSLRRIAGLALLNAAVTSGATPAANGLLAGLRTVIPDAYAQAWFDYQDGRLKAAAGNVDGAIAAWDKVLAGEVADAAAHASFDRVQLLRREGKITVPEAIDALDRLRVTWRGDELQFATLSALGHLQSETGDSLAALRNWRDALSQFPHHAEAPSIAQAMIDLFARTLAESTSSAIPPWKTVALFEEFKELAPADARGRALLSAYADRLAAAELRPQAAAVLEKMLVAMPPGEDKAELTLKLAGIYLDDGKAAQAMAMAQSADGAPPSEPLPRQRRLLSARALQTLGRPDEALAAVSADQGADVDAIRLAIYRRKGDWAAAAAALERMGGESPATAAADASPEQRWLDQAAALALANDPTRLARLRNDPQRPGPATAVGEALDLIVKPGTAIAPQKEAIAAAVDEAEKLAAAARRATAAPPPAAAAATSAANPGESKTSH